MKIYLIPILINMNIYLQTDIYKGKISKKNWDIIDSYKEGDLYDSYVWWCRDYFNLHPDVINMLYKNYNLKASKNQISAVTIVKGFKGLAKILKFLKLLSYGDDPRSFKKL